jgi:hypothetical protein
LWWKGDGRRFSPAARRKRRFGLGRGVRWHSLAARIKRLLFCFFAGNYFVVRAFSIPETGLAVWSRSNPGVPKRHCRRSFPVIDFTDWLSGTKTKPERKKVSTLAGVKAHHQGK